MLHYLYCFCTNGHCERKSDRVRFSEHPCTNQITVFCNVKSIRQQLTYHYSQTLYLQAEGAVHENRSSSFAQTFNKLRYYLFLPRTKLQLFIRFVINHKTDFENLFSQFDRTAVLFIMVRHLIVPWLTLDCFQEFKKQI